MIHVRFWSTLVNLDLSRKENQYLNRKLHTTASNANTARVICKPSSDMSIASIKVESFFMIGSTNV